MILINNNFLISIMLDFKCEIVKKYFKDVWYNRILQSKF